MSPSPATSIVWGSGLHLLERSRSTRTRQREVRTRSGNRRCLRPARPPRNARTVRATRSARGAIQLIDILNGEPSMVGKIDAWNWTKVLYHCAEMTNQRVQGRGRDG